MAKGNANSGNATLLDDFPADVRPAAARGSDARPPRFPRADPHPGPDPDPETGEPFLRARRRVPVRRGLLPVWTRTRWGKLLFAACILAVLGLAAGLALAVRSFLDHDPRFRIASADSIQTMGNSQLTRSDLLSVFGGDVGHNLFFVPLAKRRAALEQIPWVESATVMRLLPNQLRVAVKERTPIAFVEVHGRIELADVDGVILSMTPRDMAAQHYSFPVVTGIRPADPLPERSLRMHLYQRFVSELDASGQRLSGQLSEIDLSDPEDVRATVPGNGSDMLLYFGQEDFLSRWRNYQDHIGQWRQQYPQLASVDLRYEHQVVLKMAGDPDIDPAQNSAPAPAVRKASSAARPAHPAHPGEIARRHAPSRARHAHEKHSARHPARRSA